MHSYSTPPGIKYVVPKTRKQRLLDLERKKKLEADLHFCKYSVMRLGSPLGTTKLDIAVSMSIAC